MIEVSDICARVGSLCPAYLSVHDAITAVEVAKKADFRSPGAFVLEPSETPLGDPNGSGGRSFQQVLVEFGVLTGVRDMRDDLGAPNAAAMRVARAQLRDAMLGWQPLGPAQMELQMGVCRPFGFDDATYWFLDSFRLTRLVASTWRPI